MKCIALHSRNVSESLNAVTKALVSLRQGQNICLWFLFEEAKAMKGLGALFRQTELHYVFIYSFACLVRVMSPVNHQKLAQFFILQYIVKVLKI